MSSEITVHRAASDAAVNSSPTKADYVCPMHAQTVRDASGSCPSCGMAIALGVRSKVPGESMIGRDVELLAAKAIPDEMKPYERLLRNAMKGDATESALAAIALGGAVTRAEQ